MGRGRGRGGVHGPMPDGGHVLFIILFILFPVSGSEWKDMRGHVSKDHKNIYNINKNIFIVLIIPI